MFIQGGHVAWRRSGLAVYERAVVRCSGIVSGSWGITDALGAMLERGERAAHAR